MHTFHNLLSTAERNLSSSRFRVSRAVALPNGTTADLAASRTTFSWKGLVIISQHLLLRHTPTVTVADFHALFDEGFLHAKRVNRVPLLRGMQFGYMVIPCIAVDAATPDLIAFASSRPRKHWCIFEFPVLHDLSTGQTHYYHETAMWGALFFSDLRSLTQSQHCYHMIPSSQTPKIAGAAAGWKSQVIEISRVVVSRRSGSAQLWGA
jgi:hypothetical protein